MNDSQGTSQTTYVQDTNITSAASTDAGILTLVTNATPHTSATPVTPAAPSAVVAGPIVDELLRLGVVDAVVCPGSWSASPAHALVQAADAVKARLHVRIDECSTALLALGLASHARKVIPVTITSGTAVADLAPAMVETTTSGIPLLALIADHPVRYRGAGANQTVVQDRLFANVSVVEFNLDDTASVMKVIAAQIRAHIGRVVAAMTPGVGHLNVRFVGPLMPDDGSVADISEGRTDGGPWTMIAPTNSSNVDTAAIAVHLVNSATTNSTNAAGTATTDISRRTLVIASSNTPHLPELEDSSTITKPNAYASTRPVHPLATGTFMRIPSE